MTTSAQSSSESLNLRGFDVAGMLRRLAAGATTEDLLRESPGLSRDDLCACFAYAAEILGNAAPGPAKIETVEWTAESGVESSAVPPPAAEAVTLPPDQCSTSLLPAKRISLPGYEILGKIGEGGMGVVYKARHLRLNRLVAIKMILAGEHASEEMIARFALEAEAVAQLQHPGIVQIHEIGEHDGHAFLALEYVAGGSLAARLNDKPWSAVKAAELVETLARAMQAAHNSGIIHRDLKPENVLLAEAPAEDGRLIPKITDFGLAKRLNETAGQTRTGEIMGTPSYMAPEQAAGKKDIGPAADVYALGAVLYRLLTGRPPFQADTSLDTIMLVLEQEPLPPRSLNKSLPRDLETISLKCLAKEPAKRYASAAELADDLRRFLDGEPIKARRLSHHQRLFRWCRKNPGAAVTRGVLALALLWSLVAVAFYQNLSTLMIPAWIFGAMLSLGAVIRTKLRPFLIGFLFSLLLETSAVLVVFFLQLILLLLTKANSLGITKTSAWDSLTDSFTNLNPKSIAVLACLFPLFIGLIRGLFSHLPWRALGYCLVIGFLLAATQWSEAVVFNMLYIIAVGLYFGSMCRFICWYTDGNLIDSIVGALFGAAGGFVIGCPCSGLILFALAPKSDSAPATIATILAFCLGPTIMSILGAYIGAIRSKKNSRRGRG